MKFLIEKNSTLLRSFLVNRIWEIEVQPYNNMMTKTTYRNLKFSSFIKIVGVYG